VIVREDALLTVFSEKTSSEDETKDCKEDARHAVFAGERDKCKRQTEQDS
jgi:hypothetical protein